jgi:hypothetical protein
MTSELHRAHEIANKIIRALEKNPRYLEQSQDSSRASSKGSESLSAEEIKEIEKKIEEKGYKLPELKNKRPRDEWWHTFDWWR